MTGVTAAASGGTYSYGVFNYYSNLKTRHTAMDGGTAGLFTSTSGTAPISQSTIINGVGVNGTRTNQSVSWDSGCGAALMTNCISMS